MGVHGGHQRAKKRNFNNILHKFFIDFNIRFRWTSVAFYWAAIFEWLFVSFINFFRVRISELFFSSIGGSSAVVYAYVGEFHNVTYRPKVISWMAFFIAFGSMLLPAIAWVILPLTWSYPLPLFGIDFRPWRLLLILYGLASIVFASFLWFIPDSPRFYLSQGRNQEGLDVIKRMFEMNTGKSGSEFPVKHIIWDEAVSTDHSYSALKTVWEQIAPLFRKKFIWKTLMVSTLQFGIFFGYVF